MKAPWLLNGGPDRALTRVLVDIRTKTSETRNPGVCMAKRDSFLAELREEAKARGLTFNVSKRRGKGSHALVQVRNNWTTVPHREIDPKTARKIRKGLGLI
jgi:hypothetical protein